MIFLSPTQLSLLFHFAFLGIILIFINISPSKNETTFVPIEVSAPQEVQNLAEIKQKPKVVLKSINEIEKSKAPSREIFGVNKSSYTDDTVSSAESVIAKKGNTITKESDRTVLLDSDAEALPTPTEEYLVSQMPSVLKEIRPVYPTQAKDQRIEGAVAMDILIDEKGNVRQVSFVDGPQIFVTVAIEAMKKFKFRPAMIENKQVAVKIRYTLRFQLEY